MKLKVRENDSGPLPEAFIKSGITFDNIIQKADIKRIDFDWYVFQLPIRVPDSMFIMSTSEDISIQKIPHGIVLYWDWIESVRSANKDVDEYCYDVAEAIIEHRLNLRLTITQVNTIEQEMFNTMPRGIKIHNSRKVEPIEDLNTSRKSIVPYFIING